MKRGFIFTSLCVKPQLFRLFDYFSGCPPTHYGPLCNTTCPPNCKGPCDLDVGHCIFGCTNGWTGDRCDQGENKFYMYNTIIFKSK